MEAVLIYVWNIKQERILMHIYTCKPLMRINSSTTQITGSNLKFKGKIWDICHLYSRRDSRSLYSKGTTLNLFKKECVKQLVSYLKVHKELPAPDARRAFEVRMGMLDISIIIRTNTICNPNLKYRVCNEHEESLKHFFECESYISYLRTDKQFAFMWIYEEGVEKINKSVQINEQTRDELINKQTKTTSINDELGTTQSGSLAPDWKLVLSVGRSGRFREYYYNNCFYTLRAKMCCSDTNFRGNLGQFPDLLI